MITKYLPGNEVSEGLPAHRLAGRLRSIGLWLAKWVDTRAARWAAAEIRLQLSRLSDAELARRGLSRALRASEALTTPEPRLLGGEPQHFGLTQLVKKAADASRRWGRSAA